MHSNLSHIDKNNAYLKLEENGVKIDFIVTSSANRQGAAILVAVLVRFIEQNRYWNLSMELIKVMNFVRN